MQFTVNVRRQSRRLQFQSKYNAVFITVCQQRTSTVPKNRGTCGIAVLKSTVKATVLVL